VILVGGLGLEVASRGDGRTTIGSEGGLLGAVAIVLAIVSWFTIVFTGVHIPKGLYAFGVGALRWRLRVETYILLMVDEYPPFSLR
jgi:hypothetical protein